jgi:Icc-related predicted phosphoesterase
MKIWAISDTHGMHRRAIVPENIDCVIHSGDSTNYKDLLRNEVEFRDFLDWYSKIDVRHKILIAGNHDAWATKLYLKEMVEEADIVYLEHESHNVEGISIFGSPYTPNFRDWYFMKDRGKLDRWWQEIPENTDILVTHGPPQGILDLSRDRFNNLEYRGDKSLLRHVNRVKPKYHIFGHLHDFEDCLNYGIRKIDDITFMNVSSVEDGRFDKGLIHNGIVFEI